MNHTLKNLLALVLFIISLSFLIAATSMQNNEASLFSGNCHHCGTESACRDGGQAYGWDDCYYNDQYTPPDNCSPIGGSNCGAGSDPGESD